MNQNFNFGGKNQLFLILLQFMKIKVPAVFKLGTCRLVDRSNTNCATEIDDKFWRYKLFHNALKLPYCDVLSGLLSQTVIVLSQSQFINILLCLFLSISTYLFLHLRHFKYRGKDKSPLSQHNCSSIEHSSLKLILWIYTDSTANNHILPAQPVIVQLHLIQS